VTEAQDGDAAAMDRLYRRYAPRVLRTVAALTRDASEAQDVAHDAFLIAWERLDAYRPQPGGSFGAWLLTIAMNVARQRHRKHRRLELVAPRHFEREPHDDPGPRDAMERRHLATFLSKLPERDRQVLALRYAGELTSAEVAAALNLSESNVRKICERRRRELLDGMGGSR
jgi:RNA polymerase sigma-70 factor (ECF subfamily)